MLNVRSVVTRNRVLLYHGASPVLHPVYPRGLSFPFTLVKALDLGQPCGQVLRPRYVGILRAIII